MKIDPATIATVNDGILSLPSKSNLTRQPSLYLYWKQALCDTYNKLDLLHYLLDGAAYIAFKRLDIGADIPARRPRAIQLFPQGYTTLQRAQNDLNASIHEVLDALCIHTIDKMDAHLNAVSSPSYISNEIHKALSIAGSTININRSSPPLCQ